jgi:nitrogen fixation protein FixH
MTMSDAGHERKFTGRMALAAFIIFFGIVFAVNGVMLTMALRTHSGVVANEPYRKGLKYNERIAADEQQSVLGWSSSVSVSGDARRLVVEIADRDGRAVDGVKAVAVLGRPSTMRNELRLDLAPVGAGRYEAALPTLEPGAYVASLDVAAARGGREEIVYRARRRLWLKP